MEDIFGLSDTSSDVFDDMSKNKTKGNFTANKKVNYWEKTDITPKEIDVTKFSKSSKSFTIYTYPENDVPDEAKKRILVLAKGLMSKGYIFRHTGNADNVLQNAVLKLEGAKYKSYLPWKKFNSNISSPVLSTPIGYQVAIGVHKAFMRLPPAVRAIISRDVNALIGEDATDPVDLVLAWTAGGAEALTKNADFKSIGNNTFMLQIAKRANLPVVNVFNSNFIDRFKEIVKEV